MASKPQLRAIFTQQNILSIAKKLFDAQGYDATPVDQIASEANVAKGSIFAHFADKASLLTAVRIVNLENVINNMMEVSSNPSNTDPPQAIIDLLAPLLALFANDSDFTQVFLNQAELKSGPWAERLYYACCSLDKALEQTVSAMIKDGRIPQSISVNFYTQGIQAFFYHVLIGLHSGATKNKADQELLLRGLLTHWLRP